jgi:acyl dehydratase
VVSRTFSKTLQINKMSIAWMAVAIEDPNPIHIDEEAANKAGFPSVIAHGTFPIGLVGQMLSEVFGPSAIREISIRLQAPTFPGVLLEAYGEVDKNSGDLEKGFVRVKVHVRQASNIVAYGDVLVQKS